MTRRRFTQLATFLAVTAPAAADQGAISRMLRDLSRALQARNAALFLSHFDKKRFEEYPKLESNVVVLSRQKDLASSIQIVEVAEAGDAFRSRVDWLLQISPLNRAGTIETRRNMITLRIAAQGRKWRIIDLAPIDFFRPG